MVLARFDLSKTWRELVIAVSVPVTLFVVSFIALCIITRSVKVGDDAKMRCKYCTEVNTSDVEDDAANKYQCGLEPDAVEQNILAETSAVRRYLSTIVDTFPGKTSLMISFLQSQMAIAAATLTPPDEDITDELPRIVPPINLSPCTETTEKSSISTNIELKENDDPLLCL